MTTENLDKDVVVDEEKVVVSPVESAARESGWVSKDEWIAQGKNPDDWRSAKEFQERGELFEEIHNLKETYKKQAGAFKVLLEHHKKVREIAVKEALEKLKAEKKEALREQDIERVYILDEEIDRVRDQPIEVPKIDLPDEVNVGPTPTFTRWHKRNTWYQLQGDDGVEGEASRYADREGAKLKTANKDLSESELLDKVESKVARRFPELFENPAAKRRSEVNPRSDTKVVDDSNFKLSDAEEMVCNMLVKSGDMTRKQYIDEIKKTRGA